MVRQDKKPNVILIVVDQMRSDALSINREDDLVVTPTLDITLKMRILPYQVAYRQEQPF